MRILLNEDKEVVKAVRHGLAKTVGYCPCMLIKNSDTKCICADFKRKIADPDFEGYCHCLLYYKEK